MQEGPSLWALLSRWDMLSIAMELGLQPCALFSQAASPDIQGSGTSVSVAVLWSLQTSVPILKEFFLAGSHGGSRRPSQV